MNDMGDSIVATPAIADGRLSSALATGSCASRWARGRNSRETRAGGGRGDERNAAVVAARSSSRTVRRAAAGRPIRTCRRGEAG